MFNSLLMTFIFNLLVLFGAGYFFGRLAPYLPSARVWLWRFIVGMLAAGLTIISQLSSFYGPVLQDEKIFLEVGVVATALAAMFGSFFSGLASVGLVALYFYSLGEWNMLPGIITLATAAVVGGFFYLLLVRKKELLKPSFNIIFYCGLTLGITTLGSFFFWLERPGIEYIFTSGFFIMWLTFIPIGVLVFTRVVFDILNHRYLLRKTSMQASTDYLTGLFNRRHNYYRLEREIERARRYGHPFSLLIIDIDHFKAYNDCHGHLAGDAALVQVADVICKTVRTIDQVARWGGEEFSVILPETDLNGAVIVAERICKNIEDIGLLCTVEQGQLKNTVSIGVSTYLQTASSMDMLLSQADEALYRAKEYRNCVAVYQHEKKDGDIEGEDEAFSGPQEDDTVVEQVVAEERPESGEGDGGANKDSIHIEEGEASRGKK